MSIRSSGSTTLPSDFEIFRSLEQQIAVHEELLRQPRSRQRAASPASRRSGSAGCPCQQMPDGGPEAVDEILAGSRVGQRAQVVDERVRPDVRDLLRIPRDRDAPRLARTADREVLQPAGDEASAPRSPGTRAGRSRPLVVEREQLLLVRGEPEEPVALLDPLGLDVVLGALAVDELVLGLERLAADAVQPRVDVLVDVVAPLSLDPLAGTPGRTACGRRRSCG